MRKYFCFTLFLVFSIITNAQLNYFVYLQTDNKQPFYIKINDKLISSSSAGYTIIPKLTNGNHNIIVGFPKDQWPQQNFSFNITNNDAGYYIKNFGDKGWGLFNLQTLEVIMAAASIAIKEKVVGENDDAFAAAIAGKEAPKLVDIKPKEEAVVEVTVKEISPPVAILVQRIHIEKVASSFTTKGYIAKYVSHTASDNDTVNVEIPKELKINYPKKAKDENVALLKKEKLDLNEASKEVVAKESKFLDIEFQNPNAKPSVLNTLKKEEIILPDTSIDKKVETQIMEAVKVEEVKVEEKKIEETEVLETPKVEEKKNIEKVNTEIVSPKVVQQVETATYINKDKPLVPFNSDCKIGATQEEFKKLRKKMAGETTDADMILVANKFFKTKCFSVEQVKNLSLLFLNDKGKYGFFDEAYPYTIDTQNFVNLQSQLHDAYYINRFKAMIGY